MDNNNFAVSEFLDVSLHFAANFRVNRECKQQESSETFNKFLLDRYSDLAAVATVKLRKFSFRNSYGSDGVFRTKLRQ